MSNQIPLYEFDALKDASAELYEALKAITTECAASDHSDLLLQSLYNWFIWVLGEDPEQDSNIERTIIIREAHLSALLSTLQLMRHLYKVDGNWNAIAYLERQLQSNQE